MNIVEFIAKELQLGNFSTQRVFSTTNNVTVAELRTESTNYRVHFIEEPESDTKISLEDGCKVSAFYNSLFWNELNSKMGWIEESSKFIRVFMIKDLKTYSVYLTSFKEADHNIRIEFAHLSQIVQLLAKLHSFKLGALENEFYKNVYKNYMNIYDYQANIQEKLYSLIKYCSNNFENLFGDPVLLMSKINKIKEKIIENRRNEPATNFDPVICHGKLHAVVNCHFDKDKLVEISDWENIHLGNPAEDITDLIVSSFGANLTRVDRIKLLQIYYYSRVELGAVKFQIKDLKKWYHEHQLEAIVNCSEKLLTIITSSNDDQLNRQVVKNWLEMVDEAIDFIDDTLDDTEQLYFVGKLD